MFWAYPARDPCRWAALVELPTSPTPSVPLSTPSTVSGLLCDILPLSVTDSRCGDRARAPPCRHPPGARFALVWAERQSRLNTVPPPATVWPARCLCALAAPVSCFRNLSTDTVQQLCHSSNLQLQKSAPCTDIHGTQGSQVQILYHKLVPWY